MTTAPDRAPPKILLVDDTPQNIALLEDTLSVFEADLLAAEEGVAAAQVALAAEVAANYISLRSQQQRLQIARNLVTHPKLVFMDEPTGGLDVSVQARLLDLLRVLVVELNLAVVIVTHDLGVARLLADRLLVMKQGQVVESGLTDRVLDDPHHPYTQLLVSSVLQN